MYLEDKSEKEMEVKKEGLQMKRKLQEDQLMEQRSMRQQQAHMIEAVSTMQQSIQRQLQQQGELSCSNNGSNEKIS